jgi:hypothetical protein
MYVPGSFTWCEFDWGAIDAAVGAGKLNSTTLRTWFAKAFANLKTVFGPYSYKLVWTGEGRERRKNERNENKKKSMPLSYFSFSFSQ